MACSEERAIEIACEDEENRGSECAGNELCHSKRLADTPGSNQSSTLTKSSKFSQHDTYANSEDSKQDMSGSRGEAVPARDIAADNPPSAPKLEVCFPSAAVYSLSEVPAKISVKTMSLPSASQLLVMKSASKDSKGEIMVPETFLGLGPSSQVGNSGDLELHSQESHDR